MTGFVTEYNMKEWDRIHMAEKLRLANSVMSALENKDREAFIARMVVEIELNKETKVCPNDECRRRDPRSQRKCNFCGKWYEKTFQEAGQQKHDDDEEFEKTESWSPENYYKHVDASCMQDGVTTELCDPMLGNPNSKINVLALLHQIKGSANIDGDISLPNDFEANDSYSRERNRQWVFVACDALIALQV